MLQEEMEQRNNEFLQRKKEYEEQERLRRKAEERRKFEERMAEFERERAAEHERLKKIEEEKIRERQKLREERSGYVLTGIYMYMCILGLLNRFHLISVGLMRGTILSCMIYVYNLRLISNDIYYKKGY